MASASALSSGAPCKLTGGPLNLLALREDALAELISILERLPGRILIVMDSGLLAPMKLIVTEGSKSLREHRVEGITELAGSTLSTDVDSVLYLTRPSVALAKLVSSQVQGMVRKWESGKDTRKNLFLYFVPRRTFFAEQVLKDDLGEWWCDGL